MWQPVFWRFKTHALRNRVQLVDICGNAEAAHGKWLEVKVCTSRGAALRRRSNAENHMNPPESHRCCQRCGNPVKRTSSNVFETNQFTWDVLWMEEILNQSVNGLCHHCYPTISVFHNYLIVTNWCRIYSICSIEAHSIIILIHHEPSVGLSCDHPALVWWSQQLLLWFADRIKYASYRHRLARLHFSQRCSFIPIFPKFGVEVNTVYVF